MKEHTLEQQVQDMHEAGYSIRAIALEKNIDKSKVQRILKKLRETDDTRSDTTSNYVFDTGDTAYEPPFNTRSNTGVSALDTPADTCKEPRIAIKNIVQNDLLNTKSFTLAETRHLMRHIALLTYDIDDYVLELVDLHSEGTAIMAFNYTFYLRRAKRLLEYTKLLAVQLQEDHEELPATILLKNIKVIIQNNLSDAIDYTDDDGQVWLDIKEPDIKAWQNFLEVDLFNPIAY